MKALCIIGSPRKNGTTATVVDKMIAGLLEKGVDVKRYGLGTLNINYWSMRGRLYFRLVLSVKY